jgi:hypothetical protein
VICDGRICLPAFISILFFNMLRKKEEPGGIPHDPACFPLDPTSSGLDPNNFYQELTYFPLDLSR